MNIFLTGASSGIGKHSQKNLPSKGATLGLVARRKEKLDEIISRLPHSVCIKPLVCDVTDREKLMEEARKFDKMRRRGCGNRLCRCLYRSNTIQRGLGVFDQVFETNVLSMASTFHAFEAPMMEKEKRNVGWYCQRSRHPRLTGEATYCASKSAVITYFCESLRVEMKKHGVDVVTISPDL